MTLQLMHCSLYQLSLTLDGVLFYVLDIFIRYVDAVQFPCVEHFQSPLTVCTGHISGLSCVIFHAF
jgi:hypothetical protein